MRILVSETNWSMATLATLMRNQGFFVNDAANGDDVIAHVEQGQFDAVLIDPDLPDMEFTRLIRRLRAMNPKMPICMFARDSTDTDRVKAFGAGADDVRGWPFDGPEIASRLRAFVRRSNGFSRQEIGFHGLAVDLDRQVVRFGKNSMHLTRLEYELVEMLALADGRLVDRDAIMTKLYGWENEPDAKIIDVYICRIRAKLAIEDAADDLIATSFGRGYRLNAFAVGKTDAAA